MTSKKTIEEVKRVRLSQDKKYLLLIELRKECLEDIIYLNKKIEKIEKN